MPQANVSGVLEKEAIGTQTRTEGSVETREKAATSQSRREVSGNPPCQQPGLSILAPRTVRSGFLLSY